MKNTLLFFVTLFLLFLDGVFGESVSLSVMEGDSVTLHTDLTEIKKDDVIEWRFGSDLIARINRPANINKIYDDGVHGTFKDRLTLGEQNGYLTIRNIRTTDLGFYKVTISSTTKIFSVKVVSADEDKLVSVIVNEGDSVTLRTDVPDIQRVDEIRWRFGQQTSPDEINRTAEIFNTLDGPDGRFRGRLELNNQTGSLIITNTRTTDSGLYEAEINSTYIRSRYTIHHTQSFNVTVRDDVKSVLLMERDSVTLRTGLTEIQRDDEILWKFGDQVIARLNGNVNKTRRNIDLNSMTGDLTIRNIRRDQRGDYKVEIITRRMILHSKYSITVGDMTSVSVKEGESVTLQIVTEIQSDDLIEWMFGRAVIAEIYKASHLSYTHNGPDGIFSDRLQLDNQTGSLTITNTRTTDSGNYKAEITGRRYTINKIITVTVSGSGLSPGAVAGIVVAVVVLLAAAVVVGVVVYYRRKISELKRQREENGVNLNTEDR